MKHSSLRGRHSSLSGVEGRAAWRRLLGLLILLAACGSKLPGETCRTHDDCKSLSNGYCARAEICTRECSESAPCVEGSVCISEGARRVCLPLCTMDSQCPKGFVCQEKEGASVCRLVQPLFPPPS